MATNYNPDKFPFVPTGKSFPDIYGNHKRCKVNMVNCLSVSGGNSFYHAEKNPDVGINASIVNSAMQNSQMTTSFDIAREFASNKIYQILLDNMIPYNLIYELETRKDFKIVSIREFRAPQNLLFFDLFDEENLRMLYGTAHRKCIAAEETYAKIRNIDKELVRIFKYLIISNYYQAAESTDDNVRDYLRNEETIKRRIAQRIQVKINAADDDTRKYSSLICLLNRCTGYGCKDIDKQLGNVPDYAVRLKKRGEIIGFKNAPHYTIVKSIYDNNCKIWSEEKSHFGLGRGRINPAELYDGTFSQLCDIICSDFAVDGIFRGCAPSLWQRDSIFNPDFIVSRPKMLMEFVREYTDIEFAYKSKIMQTYAPLVLMRDDKGRPRINRMALQYIKPGQYISVENCDGKNHIPENITELLRAGIFKYAKIRNPDGKIIKIDANGKPANFADDPNEKRFDIIPGAKIGAP